MRITVAATAVIKGIAVTLVKPVAVTAVIKGVTVMESIRPLR